MAVDLILDEARTLARARGHRCVTDAHLLSVLLAMPAVVTHLVQRSIATPKLADWARDRLAATEVTAGYRDGGEPEVPVAIQTLLANAPAALKLADALLVRNELDALRWDEAPIRAFYDAATRMMKACRHAQLLFDHAFAALAAGDGDDGRFGAALDALGRSDARPQLRARITPIMRGGQMAPLKTLVRLVSAKSAVRHRRELALDLLVVDLLRQPLSARIFEDIHVAREDLLFAYVHRRAPIAPAPKPGPVEVVFFDDDTTTMEEVVTALVAHFKVPAEEANALMRTVHERGEAILAAADGGAAVEAIRACRALVPTLRIELR